MEHCFRLTKGTDLKKYIESYVIQNKLSGFIACCVGSLDKITIRLAGATEILEREGKFEIVSVTGTLSEDGVHIHISVSDEQGNTIGGHLKDGCIVDTTAEVILICMKNNKFNREFDSQTGYKELTIHR